MATRLVKDRWGNVVELTDERWQHIAAWHPDLADHLEGVLGAIKRGRRRQDALEPDKYRYYWPTDALLPDYNHIVVVVKLAERNYVLTAYPIFIYGQSHRGN